MAPRTASNEDGAADPMLPRMARLHRRQIAGPETWTLDLDPEGWSPQPFVPGQFNMLLIPGVGEVAVSFSGDPASGGPLVHTVRAVGAVSSAITKLRAGDSIGVRGPYLSVERNMKCAVGHCGHCQFSTVFACKDGPVFCYDRICSLLMLKEI